jgi:hypothetical protein
VPGTLERDAQATLVLGARACLSSGFNAGAIGKEPSELAGVLVVDDLDLLDAERTHPAPTEPALPPVSALSALTAVRRTVTARPVRRGRRPFAAGRRCDRRRGRRLGWLLLGRRICAFDGWSGFWGLRWRLRNG